MIKQTSEAMVKAIGVKIHAKRPAFPMVAVVGSQCEKVVVMVLGERVKLTFSLFEAFQSKRVCRRVDMKMRLMNEEEYRKNEEEKMIVMIMYMWL